MRYIPWSRYNEENDLLPRVYRKRHLPVTEPENATMEVEDLEDDEFFDEDEPEAAPAIPWVIRFPGSSEIGRSTMRDILAMYHTLCPKSECYTKQWILVNRELDIFEYRLMVEVSPHKKIDTFLKRRNGRFVGQLSFRFKPVVDGERSIMVTDITDVKYQYRLGCDSPELGKGLFSAVAEKGTYAIVLTTSYHVLDVRDMGKNEAKRNLIKYANRIPYEARMYPQHAERLIGSTGGGTSGS